MSDKNTPKLDQDNHEDLFYVSFGTYCLAAAFVIGLFGLLFGYTPAVAIISAVGFTVAFGWYWYPYFRKVIKHSHTLYVSNRRRSAVTIDTSQEQ